MKNTLPTIGVGALVGFALLQPEISGVGLAWAYTIYGMAFLAIPTALFGNVLVLAMVAWAVAGRALGRPPWPKTAWLRRSGRFALELVFGFLNPILYLAILSSAFNLLRPPGSEWWINSLTSFAWILLVAFWLIRICGAAFNPRSLIVLWGMRVLLMTSLLCLLAFTLKDALLLWNSSRNEGETRSLLLTFLRFCPLYFIPTLLLWDYLRANLIVSRSVDETGRQARSFFLLPNRMSQFTAATVIGVALVTFAASTYRRSDGNVRKLVNDHRVAIQSAGAEYDVDPRLIAAIIFVTHRDQLSPFRDAFERLLINTWSGNLQRRGPGNERWEEIGTDENPILNVALDISVGLAQIKPRTAQTASVLATGRTPDTLQRPHFYSYRNVAPVSSGWQPVATQLAMNSPIPVPSDRRTVAKLLLDAEKSIETCALILALYQKQWEATNRHWSLRERPDILATLYQIGFARSNPHSAPRSNEFGERVRQVYEQPWLPGLFETSRQARL